MISSEVVTVQITHFFFWRADGGWASQLVFSDGSKPLAGSAVLQTVGTLDEAERQRDIDLWLQSFACPRAHFLTNFASSAISDTLSSRPLACQRSTWSKPQTALGRPPLAAELASTTVPCTARSRYLLLSFAIVMIGTSSVALTASL